MEALKLEAFRIALFILPGIISLRIKTALSISAPSRPFLVAIDGLILTLINHGLFGFAKWVLASLDSYSWARGAASLGRSIGMAPSLTGEFGRQFVEAGGFPIIVISLCVGLLFGVIRYHGWDYRFLRRIKATNRTGENLVWAETLTKCSPNSYAVVACQDGSRFIGRIDTFSEESGNYEILLSHASQVQPDGTLLSVSGEGVLLTRENPIVRVELWDPAAGDSVVTEEAANV